MNSQDKSYTLEELFLASTIMKKQGMKIPIKGYKFRNGSKHAYTIGIARANDDGDDIVIESNNIREPVMIPFSAILPQILQAIQERHTS